MAENRTVSDGTNEQQNQTKQLAVRFAPEIVARIETETMAKRVSSTEIVRLIVCEHYRGEQEEAAAVDDLRDLIEDRFRHVVYEISRTRASLYRIAEQSPGIKLGTEALRAIFEITREDARIYVDKLDAEIRRRVSPPAASADEHRE